MGKIPEGWLPYAPIGNQVPGTRFIAFKVPLREAFVDKLQAEDRFTINVLLDRIPDLGLVIDLTHTTKYYNKREFLDRGVDYVKIQTPGQIVPPQHLVERFFEVVDYYLDSHKNDNSLIGVHCTHGVNRTGYMLCRYLIQRLGYSFNEAVEAVGRARGHLIERSPYLASLEELRVPDEKKSEMRASATSIKLGKKEEVAPKKEDNRRKTSKDGFRGDYRTSPGRVPMAPGRSAHRVRSRSPPPQQRARGRTPPIPVGGRSPPTRGRRSPPHYDRPVTGQPRGSQQTVVRDRIPPPMSHGRSPPPQQRGRSPPHSFRSRTPPPPSLHLSHHSPPGHMRGRSPPPVMRSRTSPTMIRRSPPRPQGRGRSPPSEMISRMPPISSRGRSPPSHIRGRSPPPMRGSSPPGHLRSRSPPGRGMSRRSPPHYGRGPSPVGHGHIPMTMPPSPPSHGHISRREQIPHGRGRSQPPGRGRSPPRRERTPPIQTSRRPSSPDYRRNEPPSDRHYPIRAGYEDGGRRGVEESTRDFNDRFHSGNHYNNERSYGAPAEYYPERYEKVRRERSLTPRRNHSYYPHQRDELPSRPEYTPPRETKRRRKTPPPAEAREKMRRSTPPSGYMNSRDGRESFKKDKREYPPVPWDMKEKDPDCREILNEKRSMRDVYPDPNHASYTDVPKYAPLNAADLREALEEEKRRRHGHGDAASYHGQDIEDRNVLHQGYSSHEYPYRSEGELGRGRTRQEFTGGSSNYDGPVRPDSQRHHGYQDSSAYPEPKHHRSQGDYPKSRDDDFRKSRGRRTKRVFDRLSRGGRGRGGGGYWP